MVIGVDVREAAPERRAGKGRVVAELVPRLAERSPDDTWLLFSDRRFDWELPTNCRWRIVSGKGPLWHRRTAAAANRACDAYFAATSFLTPRFVRKPVVLFVHDLIAFSKAGGVGLKARLMERTLLRRALRKAAGVIVNSETTKADLAARYRKLPPVTVAPLAAGPAFGRKVSAKAQTAVWTRRNLPARYLLAVGTIEPRKNFAALIEAFEGLPADVRGKTELVIVGRWGWGYGPVERALATAASTRVLDDVGDDELPALYAGALAFCYPSRYEGFGLPALEAMQSGLPVLLSDTPALRELAGDAALYCKPRSARSIRSGLKSLLGNAPRRTSLAKRGRTRARRFSWDVAADRALETIRRSAGR